MSRKSTQVAIGGLASALCLLLMFLTGMIPFATYVMPTMAGMVLVAVVRENGRKTAATVYLAVSILGIFIVPDREAALLFICFFGYYPIIKGLLDNMRIKPVMVVLKYLIFNASVFVAFWIIVNLLGMTEILDSYGDFGKYSVPILLAMGNIVFAVYDVALGNIIWVYENRFRTKFLGKKGSRVNDLSGK